MVCDRADVVVDAIVSYALLRCQVNALHSSAGQGVGSIAHGHGLANDQEACTAEQRGTYGMFIYACVHACTYRTGERLGPRRPGQGMLLAPSRPSEPAASARSHPCPPGRWRSMPGSCGLSSSPRCACTENNAWSSGLCVHTASVWMSMNAWLSG